MYVYLEHSSVGGEVARHSYSCMVVSVVIKTSLAVATLSAHLHPLYGIQLLL